MPLQVVHGALTVCSMGTCAARLKVKPIPLPPLSAFMDLSLQTPQITLPQLNVTPPQVGMMASHSINGQLLGTANFQGGVKSGESVVYGAQGEVAQRLSYVGGKLHGSVQCKTDGVVTAEMNFENGVRSGTSRLYNLQGKLYMQTNYVGNVEQGVRVSYDAASGAVLKEENVVGGVVVSAKAGVEGAAAGAVQVEIPRVQLPRPELEASFNVPFDLKGVGAFAGGKPIATIRFHKPIENIGPYCLCISPANPAVAAATAAAGGVLTPVPCVPKTDSPWIPGSPTVGVLNNPLLTDSSILMCAYGGTITVLDPGQKIVTIP